MAKSTRRLSYFQSFQPVKILLSIIEVNYKDVIKNTEIHDLLLQLLQKVRSILADQFIGMYIGGSLANNSFNNQTSDIDCYFITETMLPDDIIDKIKKMHERFYSSHCIYGKKIEASYVPQVDLESFDPSKTRPYFNEGSFYLAHYGNNFAIELCLLREKGIAVIGPDIKKLIKEISIPALKVAVQKNLSEYWKSVLNDLSKFKRSDYQVFAILTMCRTLYTLGTGKIASKEEAAK